MLFVRDKGQMCNNLIQYGHVYAWGREHGRSTVSMRFAYKYPYFHIRQTRWHNILFYLLGKWGAALHLLPVITFPFEKGQSTQEQEQQMVIHKHAVVEGWRVEFFDLFLKYKQEIIQLFDFLPAVRLQARQVLGADANCLRLGVHIRRGDYRTHCGGKYFFDDDTYIRFIHAFAQQHPERPIQVFICGNDPQLQQDYYRQQLAEVQVVFPQGNPGEDLCVLSECDYLMGPPSTFSLVAALYHDRPLLWMHSSDEQLVALPQAWGRFDTLFQSII